MLVILGILVVVGLACVIGGMAMGRQRHVTIDFARVTNGANTDDALKSHRR